MIKKILIIIFLFSLNNCGYTPIYSKSNTINFTIKTIAFEGDRQINNFLKSKFLGYSSSNDELIAFEIESTFEKIPLSRDATGKVTVYQLDLIVVIKIESEDFNNLYSFNENFLLEDNDNKFKEKSYENSIKQNLAENIFDKFILKMVNRKVGLKSFE